MVKNLPGNAGDAGDTGHVGSIPVSGRFPQRRAWQPTPVFLPEKFHGQKSLAHYSPRGLREGDMTEHKYPVGAVTLRGLTNTISHIKSLSNKRGRFPFLHFFSHFLT